MTTHDYDDFAAYAADDALLDAIGAGDVDLDDLQASDDDLAALLTMWRRELDTAVAAHPAHTTAVLFPAFDEGSRGRRSWLRRHAAGVAAASVAVLLGSTGVAAAQSGNKGPLAGVHRVLFGAPVADDTALVAQVTALLDGVTVALDKARADGGATADRLSDMGDRLDHAGRLLAGDPAAPDALTARLVELRADLAALDTLPAAPPVVGGGDSGRSAPLPGDTGSRGPGSASVSHGGHDSNAVSDGDDGGASDPGEGKDGGAAADTGSDGDTATDSDSDSGATDGSDGDRTGGESATNEVSGSGDGDGSGSGDTSDSGDSDSGTASGGSDSGTGTSGSDSGD